MELVNAGIPKIARPISEAIAFAELKLPATLLFIESFFLCSQSSRA